MGSAVPAGRRGQRKHTFEHRRTAVQELSPPALHIPDSSGGFGEQHPAPRCP